MQLYRIWSRLLTPLRLVLAVLAFSALLLTMASVAHIAPSIDLAQIERELVAKPDDVSLLIDKAHALLERKRPDEAQAVLTRVDQLQKHRNADATYVYILLYDQQGELDKAQQISDWGIAKYPDDYYQWNIRARLALKAKDLTGAIKALYRCVEIDKDKDAYNYVLLARLLLQRDAKGDKEQALDMLERRITDIAGQTESSQLLQMAISINLELKRYDAALKNIEGLEKLYGKHFPYEARKASIFELAGRKQHAIMAYGEAIKLIDALPERLKTKHTEATKATYQEKKRALQAAIEP